MKLVSDIMTPDPITLTPDSNLQDAEKLMAERQVRHIPVIDPDNRLCGVVTQREFLAEAFRITDKFGAHNLGMYLAKTRIGDCMSTEINRVQPDTPLREAGEKLRSFKKRGCLLVTDDDEHLLGIVTSQDFVALALELLP
ncbi:CBS domain-containing protein [Bacterioplanes sanyensis]|uniref:CBS domain-containing protein n=1 Tax=Bacterioplanes sanyensis TaxID=1249553 RepID=UPI001678E4D7|nr:CBS domain-containing protein [Bacterioplanes sanyensis]GGY52055.1 CBS domain-containing protein [Bacterioplanes sanyensis]